LITDKFKAPRVFLFPLVLFFASVFCLPSFAVDQDITDFYPSAAPPPEVRIKKEVQEDTFPQKERLTMSAYLDVQQGYDNNVDLDSKRHKDLFLQTTGDVTMIYEVADNLKLVGGSDIFNTTYYKSNINNLLDVSPFFGFDLQVRPDIVWRNRVLYDYFSFPNNKESSFSGLILTSYARQYLTRDFYHEAGFEYLWRWYPDQKTYLTNGQFGCKDRRDLRYRVKYNFGWYSEKFFFRISNEYSHNDSNDQFQHYYDWWHYRVRPSIMYFFTDKLYTDVSLIYKYVHYTERRSTDNINKKERDNNFIFNTSLYYEVIKNVTLEVTYSYSQNNSNDPFQEYSGSIVTTGATVNF
jgi:hypothetical protein